MHSKWQLTNKYLRHYLSASNSKGHGVHSPFVFNFITNILNDRRHFYCLDAIEALRADLKKDGTVLEIEDFGAGSVVTTNKQRSVKSIASSALKPRKFAALFYRLALHFRPATVVELGTSFGISTACFAVAHPEAKVFTFEGATAVAKKARDNFNRLGLQNIRVIKGNFDVTLPSFLHETKHIGIGYVDGNHRKAPTLRYFEQLLQKCDEHSILIFDDIHWSAEMEEAWEIIKHHPSVTLTLDLFFIGIVFFRKENKVPQHFRIRY